MAPKNVYHLLIWQCIVGAVLTCHCFYHYRGIFSVTMAQSKCSKILYA